MSYNILCQKMVKRTMFPYASKPSLKWKTRRPLLLSEFSYLMPDIMCLQEVYTKNWIDTYDMWFKREGYEAHMFQSVYKSHGVSISWKKSQFKFIEQFSLRMDRTASVCEETLETDNIALIVVLQFIGNDNKDDNTSGLIISNTHLYWKPTGCYERLQQQIVLQRAIKTMQDKYPKYSVISCGDYNTTPDDAGYALLTKPRPVKLNEWQLDNLLPRSLHANSSETEDESDKETENQPLSYSEMASLGTSGETEDVQNKRRRLEQEERKAEELLVRDTNRVNKLVTTIQSESQPFKSCYATYADLDPTYRTDQWPGEPIYTNYSLWKGTLDYIFYAPENGLCVREVLSLPPEKQLEPGIPNDTFASDHISLAVRFDLAE
ncbi:RNA exonuclease ngl2 [Coemansia brasiliensis]|uniref:RNA exonuclease ngl2 n=1 Tax=Coemansia brasiliensis TaxID=2650707 RepID=A0A9W8I779_9FUNG|nr:RNA exonuclease ngl2 [Coemansia brasiliensis]